MWKARFTSGSATVELHQPLGHDQRAYDPLHRVFTAFFNEAGLKRPSYFKVTDVADWARSIETIAELRHLITHGEGQASEQLQKLCQQTGMAGPSRLVKSCELT